MKAKRKRGIDARNSRIGRLFILPWQIGVFLFVLVPFFVAIRCAFSAVSIEVGGLNQSFVGIDNFVHLMNNDPHYLKALAADVQIFLFSVPVIVAISLFLAITLNQRFRGRVVMRALYFLPVIIAAGVVFKLLTTQTNMEPVVISFNTTETAYSGGGGYLGIDAILKGLNLPEGVSAVIEEFVNQAMYLIWRSGIQIVLFIAGLQSIPASLYEVSRIDGATKWEEFWKVTFPMLRNVTFLVVIFTAIEEMVSTRNQVMQNAMLMLQGQQRYDLPTAMVLMYFLAVTAVTLLVVGPLFAYMKRRWD